MKNILLIYTCFLSINYVLGQTLKEKLILTDTKDSKFLNADPRNFEVKFDKEGNYCFDITVNNEKYFYTNDDTLGPFKVLDFQGEFISTYCPEEKDKPWYYRNIDGAKIYGPVIGNVVKVMKSKPNNNIAIYTAYPQSVYFYINDSLVLKKHMINIDNYAREFDNSCAFSENGKSIYYMKQNDKYYIYADGSLIDSSKYGYYQLDINNAGDYIFGEGKEPKEKGSYNYLFYIHTNDTILGPVRTLWQKGLKENGCYYYSGDDNGTDYIAINNTLHKNLENIKNITLIDKKNYLFTCTENGVKKIMVNQQTYNNPYSEIYYPNLDAKGNFAFFGMRDYYIYKYVNGTEIPNPITKHKVQPQPLFMSPSGEAVFYCDTDDSIYIFQDDQLLFPPLSKSKNFKVISAKDFGFEFLPDKNYDFNRNNGFSLYYIEMDKNAYFLFNSKFSQPMIPAKKNLSGSRVSKIGEIVAGCIDENGFYVIQKIGKNKFKININNEIYKVVDNIKEILMDNSYFDGSTLIFYAIKGRSFYQYSLSK